jgi:hypothetical protein
MREELKKDIDFYYNEKGYMVFTEAFLLKRGYCCDSGCKHCPYKKEKKLKKRLWDNESK